MWTPVGRCWSCKHWERAESAAQRGGTDDPRYCMNLNVMAQHGGKHKTYSMQSCGQFEDKHRPILMGVVEELT